VIPEAVGSNPISHPIFRFVLGHAPITASSHILLILLNMGLTQITPFRGYHGKYEKEQTKQSETGSADRNTLIDLK
jgi:hypothetical protein